MYFQTLIGGGCGKELATWIIDGRPDLDMHAFDVRRFCPETSSNPDWIRQRSHESYVKNYATVFPHDEPLAGRNMKQVRKANIANISLNIFIIHHNSIGSFAPRNVEAWMRFPRTFWLGTSRMVHHVPTSSSQRLRLVWSL